MAKKDTNAHGYVRFNMAILKSAVRTLFGPLKIKPTSRIFQNIGSFLKSSKILVLVHDFWSNWLINFLWQKKIAFWKWPKSIQIPMDTCDLTWPFKNRLSGHYLDHLKSSLVRVFFKILVPFRIFKNPCTCTWFFIKFWWKISWFLITKPWVGTHGFY